MTLPSARTLWFVIGMAAALISVGLLARAKARDGIIYGLKSYVMEQSPAERRALEQFANEVMTGELAKSVPDEKIVTAAFNILKQTSDAEAVNRQLEDAAKALLDRACAASQPDEDLLKLGDQLLSLSSSSARATYHDRIAAMSRDREADALKLSDLSRALSEKSGTSDGDALLPDLVEARSKLVDVSDPWIASQNAVVASALESSQQAALVHFTNSLQQHSTPDNKQRLRQPWDALRRMRLDRNVDAAMRASYADAIRLDQLPSMGLTVGLCVLVLLVASLAFAVAGVVRGPTPIDPGAETLENVEPIDFDTDAETLEAAKRSTRAGESHDTTIH